MTTIEREWENMGAEQLLFDLRSNRFEVDDEAQAIFASGPLLAFELNNSYFGSAHLAAATLLDTTSGGPADYLNHHIHGYSPDRFKRNRVMEALKWVYRNSPKSDGCQLGVDQDVHDLSERLRLVAITDGDVIGSYNVAYALFHRPTDMTAEFMKMLGLDQHLVNVLVRHPPQK